MFMVQSTASLRDSLFSEASISEGAEDDDEDEEDDHDGDKKAPRFRNLILGIIYIGIT